MSRQKLEIIKMQINTVINVEDIRLNVFSYARLVAFSASGILVTNHAVALHILYTVYFTKWSQPTI